MKTIVSLGESVIDKIYVVSELKPGLKFEVLTKKISYGGPSLVSAIFFSRLGFRVYFFTNLSKDVDGLALRKLLEKNKIKIINLSSSLKKNLVIIDSKNKTRTILRESENKFKNYQLNKKIIKSADLIFLDRHFAKFFEIIKQTKKRETEIIFDPSTEISERTLKVLRNINYPIIPWECLKFFSSSNIKRALDLAHRSIGKLIIITCGPFGSILGINGKMKIFPPYKTKEVDPTGAGDIFRAAFGFGVLKGWDLEKSIDFANFVASLHLQNLGNGDVLPSFKKILLSPKRKKKINLEILVENYKKI